MPEPNEMVSQFMRAMKKIMDTDFCATDRQFADQAYRGRAVGTIIMDDGYLCGLSRHLPTIDDNLILGYDDQEKDWNQTKFVSGGPTPPSDAKRAKLRAKRKKKK